MGQNLHTARISIQIASPKYTNNAKANIISEATAININAEIGHDIIKAIENGNSIHRLVVSHNLYLLMRFIEFLNTVPIHVPICFTNVLGIDNKSEK